MTVKQLIRKLSNMPEDAIITISNNSLYNEGTYKATNILYWNGDNTVEIDTDYKHRLGG